VRDNWSIQILVVQKNQGKLVFLTKEKRQRSEDMGTFAVPLIAMNTRSFDL
jgi:hypothetical protein